MLANCFYEGVDVGAIIILKVSSDSLRAFSLEPFLFSTFNWYEREVSPLDVTNSYSNWGLRYIRNGTCSFSFFFLCHSAFIYQSIGSVSTLAPNNLIFCQPSPLTTYSSCSMNFSGFSNSRSSLVLSLIYVVWRVLAGNVLKNTAVPLVASNNRPKGFLYGLQLPPFQGLLGQRGQWSHKSGGPETGLEDEENKIKSGKEQRDE